MFIKRKYNDADRKKWLLVLEANMMSSEESGDEDELYVNRSRQQVFDGLR